MVQDTAPESNQNNNTTKTTGGKSANPKTAAQATMPAPGFHSGWGFIEENAKIFVALGIIAALGALGYLGFDFLKTRQEKSAQAAFYSVEAKYGKLKEDFDRAKYQKLMPETAGKDQKPAKEATGNLEQDYGTLVSDLENVAREHVGTAGGAQAALLAGETYLSYNQPDKAVAIDEVAAKGMNPDKVLGALTRMQWGNALAAKGDCNAAIGIWQQVMSSGKVAFLHADASLRSGICFESLNQTDKAIEMYRKASADGGEQSSTGRTAKSFLRALEIKSKTNQG